VAIKKELWEKARVMFEAGKTLKDIQHKTNINFSSIAKKAKKEGWEKGVNSKLITNEVNTLVEKSQLSQTQLEFHNTEVEKRTRNIQFIHNASLTNIQTMMKKVDENSTHQEHKFVQETINKAGEALGVIDKSNSNVKIQNTNAQQNIQQTKSAEELTSELKNDGISVEVEQSIKRILLGK